MKRHLNILTTSIILVVALTAGAHAQSPRTQKVLANIPFAFNVGAKNLPAGRYTITVLNPTSDQKVLQLRSMDGRATAITLTTGVIGNSSEEGKLVFRRYGNEYFFAQAQMAGESTGLAAVRSKAERSHLVARGADRTIVVIAAE
jgi:hypothetical protein